MLTIGTSVFLLALAQPTVPAISAPAAQAATKADNRNDPSRMLCRKEQVPNPLPRYKKVCKTKAEWDEIDKQRGVEEDE